MTRMMEMKNLVRGTQILVMIWAVLEISEAKASPFSWNPKLKIKPARRNAAFLASCSGFASVLALARYPVVLPTPLAIRRKIE